MSGLTFVDLFAGIGGFRLALESLDCTCINSAEIDQRAITVYQQNWPDGLQHNIGDITKLSSLPEHGIMCGGVPCQSWSSAGKMQGFVDDRGQLWNDVIRLLRRNRPRGFIFENVKGLADVRNTDSLQFLIDQFTASGYDVRYAVLNAYHYGVPQNRERLFIVGAKDLSEFSWPQKTHSDKMLLDYLDGMEHLRDKVKRNSDPDDDVKLASNRLTVATDRNEFFILNDVRHGPTVLHSWNLKALGLRADKICMTMLQNRRSSKCGSKDGNPMSYEDICHLLPDLLPDELNVLIAAGVLVSINGKYDFKNRRQLSGIDGVYRIFLPHARFFATLTASGNPDVVATCAVDGHGDAEYRQNFVEQVYVPRAFRVLTSREKARIQGFPESHFLHRATTANTHLIGNAVPPPLVRVVAQQLLNCL